MQRAKLRIGSGHHHLYFAQRSVGALRARRGGAADEEEARHREAHPRILTTKK
jgi:hypothetical protein